MSVSLWRIGTAFGPYLADDLSGAGAAKVGGRYNSVGTAIVYTSSNVALTVLETVVHMAVKAPVRASNRYLIEIEVPDAVYTARETLSIADLAKKKIHFWDAVPYSDAARQIGDKWARRASSLLLEVPTAIIPYKKVPDLNVLINPSHPDFGQLKIVRREKFVYDPRIV